MSLFSDRRIDPEELPHFRCAARGVIALIRLKQIEDTQFAADRAFKMFLDSPLEEAIAMRDDLEAELRRQGKRVLFASLIESQTTSPADQPGDANEEAA